jgi:hypothetical protein
MQYDIFMHYFFFSFYSLLNLRVSLSSQSSSANPAKESCDSDSN